MRWLTPEALALGRRIALLAVALVAIAQMI